MTKVTIANHIKEKIIHSWIPISLAVFFFLLPFFWFSDGTYDLGGDDTRLYYLFPGLWGQNRVPYSWTTPDGLSQYYPLLHVHWFVSQVFVFLKSIIPNIHLQAITYGALLLTAFMSVYDTLKLLIYNIGKNKIRKAYSQIIASLGGLFYILSPLGHYWWRNALSDIFGFALFPLLFYFFLRAIFLHRYIYLFVGVLLSIFYSPVFSQFPYYIPYIIGFSIFSITFLVLEPEFTARWITYSLLYISIFIFVHSFWIIPLALSFISGNNSLSSSISSATSFNLSSQWQNIDIADTLMGLASRKFRLVLGLTNLGQSKIWFHFLIPIVSFSPIIFFKAYNQDFNGLRSKRMLLFKCYLSFFAVSLLFAYLYTVGITQHGSRVFKTMMQNIPLFGMFRNFYSKFPTPFTYFYSLSFGLALYLLVVKLKPSWAKNLGLILFATIIYQGIPFIMGENISGPWLKNDTVNSKVDFSSAYGDVVSCIAQAKRSRILSLPLAIGSWSFVHSESTEGFYVGSSPAVVFTKHDDFNGMPVFRYIDARLYNNAERVFKAKNYERIKNSLTFFGIKYLLVNENVFAKATDKFRSFFVWGYPDTINRKTIKTMLQELRVKEICEESGYALYELQNFPMESLVYIPEEFKYMNDDAIFNIIFDEPVAPRKALLSSKVRYPINLNKFINTGKLEVLESERGYYKLDLDGVENGSVLVLSEYFHTGWSAFIFFADGEKKVLPAKYHFKINGIMNGWYLPSSFTQHEKEFKVELVFEPQKYFRYGMAISGISILFSMLVIIRYGTKRIKQ